MTATTKRLVLHPASDGEMERRIASQPDADIRQACREMLAGARAHPAEREWYALWLIDDLSGRNVGQFCFKGISPDGITELGYGIESAHRGKGYATEAVRAIAAWAFRNPAIAAIEAETDPGNAASSRVLEKCGFVPTGKTGGEGPRFALTRARFRNTTEEKPMNGMIACCGLDCGTCEARIATVRDDRALREKVARHWSELNHVEITPDMINCVGCRADGVKTVYCESLCPIRQCALGKHFDTCGNCAEMDSCPKLGMVTGNNPRALHNLKGEQP